MRRIAGVVVLLAACAYHPPGDPAVDDARGSDGSQSLPDAAPADWWDPAFRVRIPIIVTNASVAAMPVGFEVGLQLDLDAAPCDGPRDAIRIVSEDGSELDRYIDELGMTDEWTWFRATAAVPAGQTAAYWLYCQNPDAGAAPADPAAVFRFFDDFDGAALSSAWQSKNTVVVANGAATIGGGGLTDSGILTTATWGPGTGVDYIVSIANPANADFWAGFQTGFPDQPPWIQWWSESPPGIRPDYASTPLDNGQFLGTSVPLGTTPHLFGVEYYGTNSMYRYQDEIAQHHAHGSLVDPTQLNFRLHNHSATTAVSYHMARVRHAIDPPPAVTLGAAETY